MGTWNELLSAPISRPWKLTSPWGRFTSASRARPGRTWSSRRFLTARPSAWKNRAKWVCCCLCDEHGNYLCNDPVSAAVDSAGTRSRGPALRNGRATGVRGQEGRGGPGKKMRARPAVLAAARLATALGMSPRAAGRDRRGGARRLGDFRETVRADRRGAAGRGWQSAFTPWPTPFCRTNCRPLSVVPRSAARRPSRTGGPTWRGCGPMPRRLMQQKELGVRVAGCGVRSHGSPVTRHPSPVTLSPCPPQSAPLAPASSPAWAASPPG